MQHCSPLAADSTQKNDPKKWRKWGPAHPLLPRRLHHFCHRGKIHRDEMRLLIASLRHKMTFKHSELRNNSTCCLIRVEYARYLPDSLILPCLVFNVRIHLVVQHGFLNIAKRFDFHHIHICYRYYRFHISIQRASN